MRLSGGKDERGQTYVVVRAHGDGRDIHHLSRQFILNLVDEEIEVPAVGERAAAVAHQTQQVAAIVVTSVGHGGPAISEAHGGTVRETKEKAIRRAWDATCGPLANLGAICNVEEWVLIR